MAVLKLIAGISVFIGAVALIMHLLELVAKRVGSKAIYISIIFVIPIAIGLAVVAINFDNLKWYEIIFVPFIGSVFILAAIFLVAV